MAMFKILFIYFEVAAIHWNGITKHVATKPFLMKQSPRLYSGLYSNEEPEEA